MRIRYKRRISGRLALLHCRQHLLMFFLCDNEEYKNTTINNAANWIDTHLRCAIIDIVLKAL